MYFLVEIKNNYMAKNKLLEYLGYPLSELFKTQDFKRAVNKITTCCGSSGQAVFIEAGVNVIITGTGTEEDPYIVNSSGGGGGGLDITAWHKTGDAATVGDFLGTLNNQPLLFKANDIFVGNLTSAGQMSLGANSTAPGTKAIALGSDATSNSSDSIALGSVATTNSSGSIAIGVATNTSNGYGGIAIGGNAQANASVSIALGVGAETTGNTGISIGENSRVTADYGVAIGSNARTSGYARSIALGRDALNTATDQIIIGSIGFPLNAVLPAYPNTRDDSTTTFPTNILYTDNVGKVLSSATFNLFGQNLSPTSDVVFNTLTVEGLILDLPVSNGVEPIGLIVGQAWIDTSDTIGDSAIMRIKFQ